MRLVMGSHLRGAARWLPTRVALFLVRSLGLVDLQRGNHSGMGNSSSVHWLDWIDRRGRHLVTAVLVVYIALLFPAHAASFQESHEQASQKEAAGQSDS